MRIGLGEMEHHLVEKDHHIGQPRVWRHGGRSQARTTDYLTRR